ncbi:MAG: hypothetical protein WDO74_11875 [Pseudomonadota bacterium]
MPRTRTPIFSDDYGKVYVRRGLLGSPAMYGDGSLGVTIRGGIPLVLQARVVLAADSQPTDHFQREEMQFYPGEVVRQGFRKPLFNGLCAGCHGSLSGYETDISVNPDILTQASRVEARDRNPVDLTNHPMSTIGPRRTLRHVGWVAKGGSISPSRGDGRAYRSPPGRSGALS